MNKNPTHVLIAGKNWKLSLAELISFLETRGFQFNIFDCNEAFFTVGMEKFPSTPIIDDLGGFTKIGIIRVDLPTKIAQTVLLKRNSQTEKELIELLKLREIAQDIVQSYTGKPFFGISLYMAKSPLYSSSKKIHRFLGSLLKKEIRRLGRSSDFMGFSNERSLPQLTAVEVLKKNLVEHNSEILLCVGKDRTILCKTTEVHNPFDFQKRDTGKPVQRRIFAMPPRIAKILLNLSHCAPGRKLLDPFCGVGTILQEALLMGANTIGTDVNPWCISAARQNLDWLLKEYNLKNVSFDLRQEDARKIGSAFGGQIDCIATEPDLGPALRQLPTISYANRIIEKLKPLYFQFISSATDALKENGRIAIVTPAIRTRSNHIIRMILLEVAESNKLKAISPFRIEVLNNSCQQALMDSEKPLIDINPNQIVGREIQIFEK